MSKKELTKNTNAEALVKEFINLSDKFHNYLLTINKLLTKSKVSEALDTMELVKPLATEIEKFKNKLPEKAVLEQKKLLEVLKAQQDKIDITSKETQFLFGVRLEMANLASEFARKQLVQKTQEDVGYNSGGRISNNIASLVPATYVSQI